VVLNIITIMNDELLKKYKLLFGEDAPLPPEHIMKTLIEMKEKGTFEKKMKEFSEIHIDVRKKFKEKFGRDLTPNDPLFDIDFDKND